jgi:hypothetical protein
VLGGSPWRPGASWSVIASRRDAPDLEGNNFNVFLVDTSTTYTIITGVPDCSFPYLRLCLDFFYSQLGHLHLDLSIVTSFALDQS